MTKKTKKRTAPKKRKYVTLDPVRPSIGLQAAYRRQLDKLIDEMSNSVRYWLESAYRNNLPVMAQDAMLIFGPSNEVEKSDIPDTEKAAYAAWEARDASMAHDDVLPANALRRAVWELSKRWQKRFDKAAPKLAKWFGQAVEDRSSKQLARILKDAGMTVAFKMTRAQRDVMNATITEQVSLIKSIPQQYLGQVEGSVMRSIQTGRDLGPLAKDLQKRYGITKRRAALIARDQNNKATASMTRARQVELGITKAEWIHSHAGKEPRPTHLANNGNLYDTSKGWFDPDPKVKRFIFPGELINCRCFSKSVIPGFS